MIRLLYIFLLFLASCGCGGGSFHKVMKVGIDPSWYPLDLGSQTAYINGYMEDLLLEMARYSGMEFELVQANWDTLREGLTQGKFDAILSSIPSSEPVRDQYGFSENALNLGPVLIVPTSVEEADLKKMGGQLVGMINSSSAVQVLERYPHLILRNYPNVPALLNGVVNGEIQAAVLDRIPAVNFVADLYAGKLKIVGAPMTHAGLHLIGSKGHVKQFDKTLQALAKKKKVEALLKKWNL